MEGKARERRQTPRVSPSRPGSRRRPAADFTIQGNLTAALVCYVPQSVRPSVRPRAGDLVGVALAGCLGGIPHGNWPGGKLAFLPWLNRWCVAVNSIAAAVLAVFLIVMAVKADDPILDGTRPEH